MTQTLNFKKIFIWLALLTLLAGLIYADSIEEMQGSKAATAAANNGVDQELAAIESTTVKPQNNTNIAWGQIQQYERQLKQNTTQYKALIAKADAEKTSNNGNVSDATRQQGRQSAQEFSRISEQLAATWDKGNCITRAKTVRATAKSRIANAEVAFSSNMNSDAINNYNKESNLMSEANAESLKEVKSDASPEDIARLKAGLIPQFNKMIAANASLLKQVGELLNQVRQMAGGDVTAIAGCAKGIVTGASDGPAGLLRPLMALMDLVRGMGSNMASTLSAITSL